MAAAGAAWGFWKTVQAVSPRAIEEEVEAGFKIGLVGLPEARAGFRELLLTDRASFLEREDADTFVREYDTAPDADVAGGLAFVVYLGETPDAPIGVRGKNGVPVVGTLDQVIEGMLALRPDLALALARRFPRFRVPACNRLIRGVSRVNASLALISALPGVFPPSAIFLPVSSVADVILLTKNQVMLVMRLAAAHGQKPAYTRQVKELLGTIGSALGWRTAARELVGLVPAGIGVALKATIAYSGTMAVGKSALWYYQHNNQIPEPDLIRAAYKESETEAQETVGELRDPDAAPTDI